MGNVWYPKRGVAWARGAPKVTVANVLGQAVFFLNEARNSFWGCVQDRTPSKKCVIMKIVFFGSSQFAVPSLEALIRGSQEVLAVVTQPDRKSGRHLTLGPTPVKSKAGELGLAVYQPKDIEAPQVRADLTRLGPDLFVVVAFGKILPGDILRIPKFYAINLHASLLPKYRGAAPINWAIIKGEKRTGVTVIRMNEYMDRGDIILQKVVEIGNRDTALSLGGRLSLLGAKLVMEVIHLIEQDKDRASVTPQREEEATYAPKLDKIDGLIDWRKTALEIDRHIRGVIPSPGAFTYFKGKILKIWEAEVLAGGGEKFGGKIVEIDRKRGIMEVMTAKDRLAVRSLQFEGKRLLSAKEFLLGCKIKAGDTLGK